MLRRTRWRFYRDAARRTGSMPWTLNAYVDRRWDATERIAGVSLECRPALNDQRDSPLGSIRYRRPLPFIANFFAGETL